MALERYDMVDRTGHYRSGDISMEKVASGEFVLASEADTLIDSLRAQLEKETKRNDFLNEENVSIAHHRVQLNEQNGELHELRAQLAEAKEQLARIRELALSYDKCPLDIMDKSESWRRLWTLLDASRGEGEG